jgi:hypothetical protein
MSLAGTSNVSSGKVEENHVVLELRKVRSIYAVAEGEGARPRGA